MVLPDGGHVVAGDEGQLRFDDRQVRCSTSADGERVSVFTAEEVAELVLIDPYAPSAGETADGGKVMAPIPGTVTRVLVEAGAPVTRGQTLLVIEAMKMELTLTAPSEGTIVELRCAAGDMVQEGRELIVMKEASPRPLSLNPAADGGPQTSSLE
ncbi:MAG: biotin/lipoyl-binding protein [Acidisphaera sp.]|nr:biotin/lipoyl-binding protein [Acidisphaera sp.]